MRALRVGICGHGIVGKKRMECVDIHPELTLVAVCDKKYGGDGVLPDGVLYFRDYRDILNLKLDIVIVCMTNDLASNVVIDALKSGHHVFCEKPPGRNMDDISRVLECANNHPMQKLMYGFNHRFHYSVMDALKVINSKELGEIISIRGVYGKSKLITFNQSDWRTNREKAGGGVLLDQGIHMVDLMRLFAGEYETVYSCISNDFWGFDVEDNAYALMKTKKGIVGMLHSSATQWRHRFNLDINLERGQLILGGLLSGTKSYGAETLKIIWADVENDRGDPKEQTTLYNRDDSWNLEINLFVDAIKGNKCLTSGSAWEAYKTMELVHKIYYSDPNWREKYKIPSPI